MDYLLDTRIVGNLRKRRPHPTLLCWLRGVPAGNVFMSAPTVAEIQSGICQTRPPAQAAEAQSWLDGLLREGYPSIVPCGAQAAALLGRMWATPSLMNLICTLPGEARGGGRADLAIAACAISFGMTIVTNDAADYLQIHTRFPLPGLYSPVDARWHVHADD